MSTDASYTIGELARAAGVTRRTIHYYVAQGLLPPPQSGGRAASYTVKHLQRLELIRLLKQEFLPLHEIKALLDGLDDEAVQSLLSEKRAATPTPARETAKEYLRALLHPPDRSSPLLRQRAADRADILAAPLPPAQMPAERAGPFLKARIARGTAASYAPQAERQGPPEIASVWQRYQLHPDLELHVRRPLTDAALSARLEGLIAEIRQVIARHEPRPMAQELSEEE